MAFDHYIENGGKKLRCGYTTGTCAALAAGAAAQLLLTGEAPDTMGIMTPKGILVEAPIRNAALQDGLARCAVEKDAGDDIDATAGTLIVAEVSFAKEPGIWIDGGTGVGRVTKPGLDQKVGEAAINRVPRQMIENAVEAVCEKQGYLQGLRVIISAPDGERIAKKTFNPHLGIVGGISILGTSGIVEPMSMQALIDTVKLELRQAAAMGAKRVILTPGNYGEDFLKSNGLDQKKIPVVKCSNFIGDALDAAAADGFESVLLVGHIGKLVKLAGGIMNTHSLYADCRTELICAHAAVCGASRQTCAELMDVATTDSAIELLDRCGLRQAVLDRLLDRISFHLKRRVSDAYQIGAILFSNQYGFLGQTMEAKEIIQSWQ